jgi:adenylate cyclase
MQSRAGQSEPKASQGHDVDGPVPYHAVATLPIRSSGQVTTTDILALTQWIIGQGLSGTPETRLLAGLCERLVAGGIPLTRANISQPTLHPVIAGHLFLWRRGEGGAVEEDWARNVREAGSEYAMTPFQHMAATRSWRLRRRLDPADGPLEFPMLARFRYQGATDYFALGASYGDGRRLGPATGMLTSWLTDAPGGFAEAHLATIERLLPALALAVKSASSYRVASNVIEAYLGKDAGQRVLGGTIERGAGETIRAALWLSDLEGFTRLADSLPREALLGLMHEYFECMVDTVEAHGGQVLKFMGDGLLAIFNLADDRLSSAAALGAAGEVSGELAQLSARRQAQGLPVSRFRIGLHLGDVLYGNIGARNRLDFTVVGPAVNEVSRIEAMGRALERDIIASAAFARAAEPAPERLVSLGRYVLRGVERAQELFTLVPPDAAG